MYRSYEVVSAFVNEAKALAAKDRAEKAMADRAADFDYSTAAAELARAAAQLRAIRTLKKKLKK